ncbi:MAG: DUF1249 domain-containing protein [Pseudomonadota bacterium]
MAQHRPESTREILTQARVVKRRGQQRGKEPRYNVDLPAHMAECDANYVRLLRIFPAVRDNPLQAITLPLAGYESQVEFTVLEKGPYTTLLGIQVKASERWAHFAAALNMTVRMYHDAQSAEVVSYQNQRRFHGKYDYPNRNMRQRDEKAQINRFLSEFLQLCLDHGAATDPIF